MDLQRRAIAKLQHDGALLRKKIGVPPCLHRLLPHRPLGHLEQNVQSMEGENASLETAKQQLEQNVRSVFNFRPSSFNSAHVNSAQAIYFLLSKMLTSLGSQPSA